MNIFVDPAVSELGVSVCVARISDVEVTKRDAAIQQKKKETARFAKERWDRDGILTEAHVSGYRRLYEKVGAGREKLTPSCAFLVNLILRSGTVPTINTVVDLYNCVSVMHLVDIGAHDLAQIAGDVRVAMTRGNERFVPLGMKSRKSIAAGEYAYFDDHDVLCRLDVRQCEKTKLTTSTNEVLIVANSHDGMTDQALLTACQHVCQLAEELLQARCEIIAFK